MLRVERDYELTAEMRQNWDRLVEEQIAILIKDWNKWALFERVGTVWEDAPLRFDRATKSQARSGMHSEKTSQINEAANPGLTKVYQNLSTFLNLRKQHYQRLWMSGRSESIWERTEKAMKQLEKRVSLGANVGHYWVNSLMMSTVWERLHASSIEAPFNEFSIQLLREGFFPAGVVGSDWRTCRFLYY